MDNFPQNLRLMCSYYSSISEVCRRLNINRQQFNKYLSASAYPSQHNINRICDFFGVEEREFGLPPEEFKEMVSLSPLDRYQSRPNIPGISQIVSLLERSRPELAQYEGYYFRYYCAGAWPDHIVKCVFYLGRSGENFYTKSTAEYVTEVANRKVRIHYRYVGIPILVNERLYLYEFDPVLNDVPTSTILYGAFRGTVDVLSGLQANVAGRRARAPTAGNVVFEYLGRTIDIRKALSARGLFPWASPDVADWVRDGLMHHQINNYTWTVPE